MRNVAVMGIKLDECRASLDMAINSVWGFELLPLCFEVGKKLIGQDVAAWLERDRYSATLGWEALLALDRHRGQLR